MIKKGNLLNVAALLVAPIYIFIFSDYVDKVLFVYTREFYIDLPVFLIGLIFFMIKFKESQIILRLLTASIFSFLVFFLPVKIGFTMIDLSLSASNPIKKMTLQVKEFQISTKLNSCVIVKMNGQNQKIYLHSKPYLIVQKKNVEGIPVKVELTYSQGIFGTLIIDDFHFQ